MQDVWAVAKKASKQAPQAGEESTQAPQAREPAKAIITDKDHPDFDWGAGNTPLDPADTEKRRLWAEEVAEEVLARSVAEIAKQKAAASAQRKADFAALPTPVLLPPNDPRVKAAAELLRLLRKAQEDLRPPPPAVAARGPTALKSAADPRNQAEPHYTDGAGKHRNYSLIPRTFAANATRPNEDEFPLTDDAGTHFGACWTALQLADFWQLQKQIEDAFGLTKHRKPSLPHRSLPLRPEGFLQLMVDRLPNLTAEESDALKRRFGDGAVIVFPALALETIDCFESVAHRILAAAPLDCVTLESHQLARCFGPQAPDFELPAAAAPPSASPLAEPGSELETISNGRRRRTKRESREELVAAAARLHERHRQGELSGPVSQNTWADEAKVPRGSMTSLLGGDDKLRFIQERLGALGVGDANRHAVPVAEFGDRNNE